MNKEQLKELVKEHFNLTEKPETFASATLEDGTKVSNDSADDFAVGQKLFVITDEGEKVAAPEGEHITESGIQLIVDAEGVLTGVKKPDEEGEGSADLAEETEAVEEAMSEEVVEETVEEEMSAETEEATTEEFEEDKEEVKMEAPSLEDIIEVIGEVVEEKMASMKDKMGELEEKMGKMEEKMSAFASEPAEEKTQPVAGEFSKKEAFSNKRAETRYEMMLNKMTTK
jgi:hypothetical protein